MASNIASVPISIGELCDKYTILQIKAERIQDSLKRENVRKELDYLEPFVTSLSIDQQIIKDLKKINEQLWTIEDAIREKERYAMFDNEFIALARSVYITNDQRFDLKNKINTLSSSAICEVKSYSTY
jgi:hypothetical protein